MWYSFFIEKEFSCIFPVASGEQEPCFVLINYVMFGLRDKWGIENVKTFLE